MRSCLNCQKIKCCKQRKKIGKKKGKIRKNPIHYSYTFENGRGASLFYFQNFRAKPGQITLDIIGFGNIVDAVAGHAPQSIFIHIEGEIRFVVGFKIALRSQRFADRMPYGIFPDSNEDSEWFSKISIFYLGDLAKAIWQSSMLFSFLR